MSANQDPVLSDQSLAEIKSYGSWLYWVAGCSLINMIALVMGSDWGFAIGLGFTDVLTYVGQEFGGGAVAITTVMSFAVIGIVILIGYFACKAKPWAFLAGLIILSLDTILLLSGLPDSIISVAVHAWAIYSLIRGQKLIKDARHTLPPVIQ